jgi:hypothetical protein
MQNDMRDRLVELIKQAEHQEALDFFNADLDEQIDMSGDIKVCIGLEHLAQYLIANGVILPPCKVGQTVYSFAYPRTDIIVIDEETVEDCHFIVETDECYYDERDIGRTVFLTKDQAEQKLKEWSENGNL